MPGPNPIYISFSFYSLLVEHLIAFKMAITHTPTSAKTAVHIVAIPIAASIKTAILTANAKTIFSFAILLYVLPA